MEAWSRRSNPAMACSRIAESRTVRVSGPAWEKMFGKGGPPESGVAGDAALGRLDGVDAAEVGGDAQRSSAVAPGRHWAEASRHGSRCAAARSPGSPVGVPRVASEHAQGVLAGPDHAELRHVGLARA